MPTVTLQDKTCTLFGNLPKTGSAAPSFTLVSQDLSEKGLHDFGSHYKILSCFPSVDTSVCATALKKFQKELEKQPNLTILHISKDLPFAQKRFCGAEGTPNAITLSAFRSGFGKDYGLEIVDGPLKGLLARAVILLSPDNQVLYTELVPEVTHEPNYSAVLEKLQKETAAAR